MFYMFQCGPTVQSAVLKLVGTFNSFGYVCFPNFMFRCFTKALQLDLRLLYINAPRDAMEAFGAAGGATALLEELAAGAATLLAALPDCSTT